MPLFDLPLDQLRSYRPQSDEPQDFAAFWSDTLAAARRTPMSPVFAPVDAGLSLVEAFDLSFPGYGGQAIKGWYLRPAGLPAGRRIPCVVEYIGYGGGRGLAHQWLTWPCAGMATLVMDTRGQGSTWQNGDTPDIEDEAGNPHHPGYMTRGILRPSAYYYRRVHTDAVRAVEAALSRPEVDPGRIFVAGGSQGGGIAIAVAAIVGGLAPIETGGGALRLRGAMADVPFLCQFKRAMEISAAYPYQEIVQYLKNNRQHVDAAFATLRYFDNLHFAPYAQAPALFSVALMDDVCPPSTVFSAFNAWGERAAPGVRKEIRVYPYNGHEQGQQYQTAEKLLFARSLAGA